MPTAGRSGRPKTTSTRPSSTNTTMAVTLIIANQYSNEPNRWTAAALTASTSTENTMTGSHSGTSGHQNRT